MRLSKVYKDIDNCVLNNRADGACLGKLVDEIVFSDEFSKPRTAGENLVCCKLRGLHDEHELRIKDLYKVISYDGLYEWLNYVKVDPANFATAVLMYVRCYTALKSPELPFYDSFHQSLSQRVFNGLIASILETLKVFYE